MDIDELASTLTFRRLEGDELGDVLRTLEVAVAIIISARLGAPSTAVGFLGLVDTMRVDSAGGLNTFAGFVGVDGNTGGKGCGVEDP